MPYNVDLMLEVKHAIETHPGQHNQSYWSSDHTSNPLDNCGTTACIAGWTIALQNKTLAQLQAEPEYNGIRQAAADLLGISTNESHQLFLNTMDEDAAMALLDEMIAKGKNKA